MAPNWRALAAAIVLWVGLLAPPALAKSFTTPRVGIGGSVPVYGSAPLSASGSAYGSAPLSAPGSDYGPALLLEPSVPPTAVAAQGPSYNIPPTTTGALGISKNTWGKISDGLNLAAATGAAATAYLGGIAAGASIPTFGISVATAGTAAVITGVGSGVLWGLGSIASYLSRDPADRKFKRFFKPAFPRVPEVTLPAGFAGAAVALNRYLRTGVRVAVLATAFIASVNRATGARVAHNSTWVHRQQRAAAKWARQAASALFSLERERDAIASAVEAEGVSLTVTAQQVAAAQPQLNERTLSTATIAALRDMTKGTVAPSLVKRILDVNAFEHALQANPPGAIQFPADLPDQSAAALEYTVAGALVGYARRFG